MLKFASAILLVANGALSQQPRSQFNEILMESARQQHEAAMQRQRIEAERQIANRSLDLEQQRIEMERVRMQYESRSRNTDALMAELDSAIFVVSQRHPDFKDYISDIQRAASIFSPGTSPDFTAQKYLEGLYTIAKYLNFVENDRTASLSPRRGGVSNGAVEGPIAPRTQSVAGSVRKLGNGDILSLVGSGLSEAVIVSKIRSSPCEFKLDPDDLVSLKKANVPETVIQAMIEAQRR
jgi:hypothetical protein